MVIQLNNCIMPRIATLEQVLCQINQNAFCCGPKLKIW